VADGAVDLPDRRGRDRRRIPPPEEALGVGAELVADDAGGELGAHRRGLVLELGQRFADGLGQAVVDEAGELADLHEGALHAAEGAGDVLGAAQLEVGVQGGTAIRIRAEPADGVDRRPPRGPPDRAPDREVAPQQPTDPRLAQQQRRGHRQPDREEEGRDPAAPHGPKLYTRMNRRARVRP
jgi:hypothetical protein